MEAQIGIGVRRTSPRKGRIFDIKRYSIHDGPGIRTTVFFKGCPLSCLWCHNPESIDREFDLMHWPSRCSGCGSCALACPEKAITRESSGPPRIDRTACTLCDKCAETCLYDALQIVGRDVTADDLFEEVENDRIFFEQSGGGVTFSGGEPLNQRDFLEDVLTGARERTLHTAVDTSGFAPAEDVERMASLTDLVLFDLKTVDEARHKELTGVSNGLILENLRRLATGLAEVWIRVPLVAGANDDDENIRGMIGFLSPLDAIKTISVLPYHSGGAAKAERIGKPSRVRPFAAPNEERIAEILNTFREAGFNAGRGG